MAAASLFLAAKVEEQPRKLEHVIKMLHKCLNQDALETNTDVRSLKKCSNIIDTDCLFFIQFIVWLLHLHYVRWLDNLKFIEKHYCLVHWTFSLIFIVYYTRNALHLSGTTPVQFVVWYFPIEQHSARCLDKYFPVSNLIM